MTGANTPTSTASTRSHVYADHHSVDYYHRTFRTVYSLVSPQPCFDSRLILLSERRKDIYLRTNEKKTFNHLWSYCVCLLLRKMFYVYVIYKQGVESEGGRESFIELEIREQRRREVELAEARKCCTVHEDKPRSSENVASIVECSLQRRDSDVQSDLRNDNDRLFDEHRHWHPGESRIVRELVEQWKREQELCRHWQQMGYTLNNVDQSRDTSVDQEEARTVQHQHMKHRETGHRSAAAPLDLKSAKHLPNSSAKHKQQQLYREYRPSRWCADIYKCNESGSSADEVCIPTSAVAAASGVAKTSKTVVHVTEEFQKAAKKIRLPFESDCDKEDHDYTRTTKFEPLAERSLDREIRAAREREKELRRARGLTTATEDESRRSVEIQIQTAKPRKSTRANETNTSEVTRGQEREHHALTQHYAENRLRTELQRDRQRELDLRRSGLIQSISGERTGQHQLEFIDVLPARSPEARIEEEVAELRQRENELRFVYAMHQHLCNDVKPIYFSLKLLWAAAFLFLRTRSSPVAEIARYVSIIISRCSEPL